MKSKRFGNKYFLRIDKGEEVVGSLYNFCKENNVKLGSLTGLGAADRLTVGLYNTETHEYHNKELIGEYEITNLTGNITTKDGELYLHLHITVGNEEYEAFGGHLNECHISGTCEIILDTVDGEVGRFFDESSGLNIFKID
ncbi:PPC domain-containing DNA-binding protein [Sporosalibacterium faouarense]|uniref:PPC domain-containing DNA-binding protein n=1 Tax=Sporosalibacterium faouarense TaxID=516123 RepID=UPI00141C4F56|nr:PPC domain-containing DNA-binding protein [Sporosalibacterium faouarense]MTI47302.1 DNA-binding protein [Bacillota bacterium]